MSSVFLPCLYIYDSWVWLKIWRSKPHHRHSIGLGSREMSFMQQVCGARCQQHPQNPWVPKKHPQLEGAFHWQHEGCRGHVSQWGCKSKSWQTPFAYLWARPLWVLCFLALVSSFLFCTYMGMYLCLVSERISWTQKWKHLNIKWKRSNIFLPRTHPAMFQCCLNDGVWGFPCALNSIKFWGEFQQTFNLCINWFLTWLSC